jgi:putative redox protein
MTGTTINAMPTSAEELKAFLESMMRALGSSEEPRAALATNTAVARLVENQHSEAKVRGFTLVQDEPMSVLGGGRGPTPNDFLIAAVGFCENVVLARQAALIGLRIGELETTVSGSWDRRGLFEIDGADSSFREITVETRVSTADAVEKVVEAVSATHRRCPVHATLRKATTMVFKLVVNGQPVSLP